MQARQPKIEVHGPAATHDQACCVDYLAKEPAVYDLGTGLFHPSWSAQERGFRLVQANTRFQKWLLFKFF